MARVVSRMCGAYINIPVYYEPDSYRVTLADRTEFDAVVAWDEDAWSNGAVGPGEGDPALDNDDAMISAAAGMIITVVRNKDGLYQHRTGVVLGVALPEDAEQPQAKTRTQSQELLESLVS